MALYKMLQMVGGVGLLALGGLLGCKELTGAPALPSGTPDPSIYQNKNGAIGMRNAAINTFEEAFPAAAQFGGLMTDELENYQTGAGSGLLLSGQNNSSFIGTTGAIDERIIPTPTEQEIITGSQSQAVPSQTNPYAILHNTRAYASLAIGALALYDTAPADTVTSKVLRGELYAVQGYAEIFLADLFCSGVPLSTLDYGHDYTYKPSSTTAQVYHDAIAKFDTAMRLAPTSDSVRSLAKVGQGRAYLALGLYDSAAAAVRSIPDGFRYTFIVPWTLPANQDENIGNRPSGTEITSLNGDIISDHEGRNGLLFLTGGDPRLLINTFAQPNPTGDIPTFLPQTIPTKYQSVLQNGYTPMILASGLEARLIQAEAAYHGVPTGTGTWLDQLNYLRQTIVIPGQRTDTTLAPLTDPGTDSARVTLIFHERAYWLFLDSHRQGDLRRLVRNYGRSQDNVYPTGQYLAPGVGTYGSDVNFAIPLLEYANPYFHGCIDRRA